MIISIHTMADALRAILRSAHSVPVGDTFDKSIHAGKAMIDAYEAQQRAKSQSGTTPAMDIKQRLADSLADAENLLVAIRAEGMDGSEQIVGETLEKIRAALDAHQAEAAEAQGDEEEREALLSFLEKDWDNSFADDSNSTFSAMWKLLREGWKGYDNMSIQDLRSEAEDAGYEDDEEEEEE